MTGIAHPHFLLLLIHFCVTIASCQAFVESQNPAAGGVAVRQLFANSTITSSAALPNATCTKDCLYGAEYVYNWYWLSMKFTTNITAATKVYIVNNATNSTSTSIKYNTLPSGHTHPPTNDAGTLVMSATLQGNRTVGMYVFFNSIYSRLLADSLSELILPK